MGYTNQNLEDEGMVGNPATADGINAAEAVPEVLDLHSYLPTQIGILNSRYLVVNPINTISNSTDIEFKIQSAENELIHPQHVYMYIACRLVKEDGTNVQVKDDKDLHKPECEVAPTNGVPTMLFKNCRVKINDTLISVGDGMYAYRADLDNKIMYPENIKNGILKLSGYYNERRTFNMIPETNRNWADPGAEVLGLDHAWHERYGRSKGSQKMNFISRIHSEIFDQPKVLPPGSKLYVSFGRQDSDRFTYETAQVKNYKIVIDSCVLLARMVKVDPEIVTGMQRAMIQGKNAVYPVRRVDMKYFTKAPSNDFSHPNLFPEGETLPRRIFIAFVENETFKGAKRASSFHYKDMKISHYSLRVGGDQIPYPQINCGEHDNDYALKLFTLLDSTGCLFSDHDIGIEMRDFVLGKNIIGFDLTHAKTPPGVNYELPSTKSCDLEMTLSEQPDGYHTMIVYAEYDAEIEIDQYKNVQKKNFGAI